MADVFISYSRKDRAFVTRLHQALKAHQREGWVDLEDIPPSAEWREKINAGIEGARAFVFVLSPESIVSPECIKEIEYAAASHKRLIPVVCRGGANLQAPEALGKLNWIFLREEDDFEKGVDALLRAVDTDLEWVDAHTNLLEKATEWDRKGRDRSLLLRGGELREAETWQVKSTEKEPKPTELMASFIVASRQGETKRQRLTLGAVTFGLVVAAVLAVAAYFQYREANRQYQEADRRGKIALSRQLAAQSRNFLGSQRDLALLLGVQAHQINDNSESRDALLGGLLKDPYLTTIIYGDTDKLGDFKLSLDNGVLAVICNEGKSIRLWDLVIHQPLPAPLKVDGVVNIAFSPDSNILASVDKNGLITFWEVRSGRKLSETPKHQYPGIKCLAFCPPDGKKLAFGTLDGNITLWDMESRKSYPLPKVPKSKIELKEMAFSPSDGKILATIFEEPESDGRRSLLVVWDVKMRKIYGKPLSIPVSGAHLTFPFGDQVITLIEDRQLPGHKVKVLYINIVNGKIIEKVIPPSEKEDFWDSKLFPNLYYSKFARVRNYKNDEFLILIHDFEGGEGSEIIKSPTGGLVKKAIFSQDNKILAVSTNGNQIILWEVEKIGDNDSNRHDFLVKGRLPDNPLAFSQNGRIAVFQWESKIQLWDTVDNRPLGPMISFNFEGNDSFPIRIALTPPDGNLLSLLKGNEVILWDTKSHKKVDQIKVQGKRSKIFDEGSIFFEEPNVEDIALDPFSKYLAIGFDDGSIRLWNIEKRQFQEETLHVHQEKSRTREEQGRPREEKNQSDKLPDDVRYITNILDLRFSPDGKILAALAELNPGEKGFSIVTLWDVAQRQYFAPPIPCGFGRGKKCLAFSPNGKLLALPFATGIFFYDINQKKFHGIPIVCPNYDVNMMAFSPDSSILASTEWYGGGATLWDSNSRQKIGEINVFNDLSREIAFSPDGKTLLCGQYFLDIDPESWKRRACHIANRNLTREEWRQYIGEMMDFQEACPGLPIPSLEPSKIGKYDDLDDDQVE